MENRKVRLIDANVLKEKLLDKFNQSGAYTSYKYAIGEALDYLNEQPTIDPESLRPHGEWERYKQPSGTHAVRCSHCKERNGRKSRFYPNCGAKMGDSMAKKCIMVCFNCIYDDCIYDELDESPDTRYAKRYRETHKEEILKYAKRYREEHKEEISEKGRVMRNHRKAMGICTRCGKAPIAAESTSYCGQCLKYMRERRRESGANPRSTFDGKMWCVKCGKRPPAKDHRVCEQCLVSAQKSIAYARTFVKNHDDMRKKE